MRDVPLHIVDHKRYLMLNQYICFLRHCFSAFPPARTAPGNKTIAPHARCPTCLTAEHKNITSGFWEGWTAHIYSTWSLLAATRNDAHYSDPDCWKLFRVSCQAHLRKPQLSRRPTEDRPRFYSVFSRTVQQQLNRS